MAPSWAGMSRQAERRVYEPRQGVDAPDVGFSHYDWPRVRRVFFFGWAATILSAA